MEVVSVDDLLYGDHVGGAELTTKAILDKCPGNLIRVRAKELTIDFINEHKHKKWIFGNFMSIDHGLLLFFIAQKLDYHMIEYDYKYCQFRIPELHMKHAGVCCDNTPRGQLVCAFFANARSNWYMSQKQKEWYEKTFPVLKDSNSHVLSSIFDQESLEYFKTADCSNKKDVFLIQEHQHPLKGTQQGIEYAKDNGLNYELFSNIPHSEVLKKFAQSRGFIFLPTEFDTCPRVTIEAKLLDCELVLSNNVQHKDEEWFQNKETIIPYMKERLECFWNNI